MLHWCHVDGTTRLFMPLYAGTLAEVIQQQRLVLPQRKVEDVAIRGMVSSGENPFRKQMSKASIRSAELRRQTMKRVLVPFEPTFIRTVLRDILSGLTAMHKKRIVHRGMYLCSADLPSSTGLIVARQALLGAV